MSKSEPNNQLKELLKSFCLGKGKVEINFDAAQWSVQAGVGSIVFDYGLLPTNNEPLIKTLKSNHLITKFWFQTQLDATVKIIHAFNKASIIPTLLKGMSISTELYPQAFYRIMRDIDILIDGTEIEQAEKILPTLGYKQSSSYSSDFYRTHHHTMPWQHVEQEIWLEVHQKLFTYSSPCFTAPVFQLDNIENEKCTDKFYDLKIHRLSYELQIIYIASHWAEQFKQVGGAFALLDIAILINKHNDELDWDKIINCSNTAYIANYMYLTLQYLYLNGFIRSTINIERDIIRLQHSMNFFAFNILNRIIDRYIFQGQVFGRVRTVNTISNIWQHLLLPTPGVIKVFFIPVAIIFPKGSSKKFNLSFQYSRFLALFKYKKGQY